MRNSKRQLHLAIFAKYYIVKFPKNTLSSIHHIKMTNFELNLKM